MKLIELYARVLRLLGDEAGLGWLLALADLGLAGAQFAQPVLFGRIVDALTHPAGQRLDVLISAWGGFALFSILCGAFVALHADRLPPPRPPGSTPSSLQYAVHT